MKKRSLFTVCIFAVSLLGFLHVGGGESLALPIKPLKIFLIDGKDDGGANVVEIDVGGNASNPGLGGTVIYSKDNISWYPLAGASSFEGGTWLYVGLSIWPPVNKPDVIGADVTFDDPRIPPDSENPPGFSPYYGTAELNWFLGWNTTLKTVHELDGFSAVPIPGSAIILMSLLGGFFALGKRKKRETV